MVAGADLRLVAICPGPFPSLRSHLRLTRQARLTRYIREAYNLGLSESVFAFTIKKPDWQQIPSHLAVFHVD